MIRSGLRRLVGRENVIADAVELVLFRRIGRLVRNLDRYGVDLLALVLRRDRVLHGVCEVLRGIRLRRDRRKRRNLDAGLQRRHIRAERNVQGDVRAGNGRGNRAIAERQDALSRRSGCFRNCYVIVLRRIVVLCRDAIGQRLTEGQCGRTGNLCKLRDLNDRRLRIQRRSVGNLNGNRAVLLVNHAHRVTDGVAKNVAFAGPIGGDSNRVVRLQLILLVGHAQLPGLREIVGLVRRDYFPRASVQDADGFAHMGNHGLELRQICIDRQVQRDRVLLRCILGIGDRAVAVFARLSIVDAERGNVVIRIADIDLDCPVLPEIRVNAALGVPLSVIQNAGYRAVRRDAIHQPIAAGGKSAAFQLGVGVSVGFNDRGFTGPALSRRFAQTNGMRLRVNARLGARNLKRSDVRRINSGVFYIVQNLIHDDIDIFCCLRDIQTITRHAVQE